MTDQTPAGGQGRGANPAQIRGDIDAGRTGDKTPGLDPAAAPLGTDEESAGPMLPPAAEAAVRREARQGAPRVKAPNAASPELAPDARLPPDRRGTGIAFALGVIAAVILALIIYVLMSST